MIHISRHALKQYQDRVHACPDAVARAEILGAHRGIEAAATIGCEIVRLASGARLVLAGERVVTVYGRDQYPRQLRMHGGHPV